MANATTLIFLIILSAPLFQTVRVQAQQQTQKHSNISLGSSLTPITNSSWLSPSGLYAFGFYPERNGYLVGVFIVGIPEKTVVWTANRDNPPVPGNATLALTSEGSLIVQQPQTQNISIADITQPASSASMLDSGNFVLYDSNHKIIWQSFDSATDTLLPGQILLSVPDLISSVSETDHSTGNYRFGLLPDGNLVSLPQSGIALQYVYWQSGTTGSGDNCTLNLDVDGHLYILNATGNNIHNVTDAEPPGVFLSPSEAYWYDLTGSMNQIKDILPHSGSSVIDCPLCKTLSNIYPSLHVFFVNECGVNEIPHLRSYREQHAEVVWDATQQQPE